DLHREVSRFANVLKGLGVQRGDRVAIYMPMIPELPVAMLACARLGAAHSVVFGGFSADALKGRIIDAEAKVLVTADGGWRRGSAVPLKVNADEALEDTPSIEHVVVVRRTEEDVPFADGRDRWYHELMQAADADCPPEHTESHDRSTLRLLGSVGEPITPEAWVWYWQHIGGGRCPVVDNWWQTETGGIMISPLPGVTTLKPGSATFPLPGIGAEVVDE